MESIVRAIEGTAINEWILSSAWLWPSLEILHFLGLSLLIGSLLIIDLRLFGWFRQIQLSVVHKLLSVTFVGFALNLATGDSLSCSVTPPATRPTSASAGRCSLSSWPA